MTAEVTEKTEFTPRVLTDFEVKVVAAALKAKARTGWCWDGVNGTLRDLGLPTRPEPRNSISVGDIVVTIPTTGAIEYRLSGGSVATREEALAAVAHMIARDTNAQPLNYGRRSGSLGFNTDEATVTGLPEAEPVDGRTDEQKQWDAVMEQVNALRAADSTFRADDDEDDD